MVDPTSKLYGPGSVFTADEQAAMQRGYTRAETAWPDHSPAGGLTAAGGFGSTFSHSRERGKESKMSSSKHTPGPWNTGAIMTLVQVRPPGWNRPMYIADCHTEHSPKSESERVANARLIAAAPDLLDACKLALRNAESLRYMLPIEGSESDRMILDTQISIYQTAIDKAEGKQRNASGSRGSILGLPIEEVDHTAGEGE